MAIASRRTMGLLHEPDFSEQVRHRQRYNSFWRDLLKEGQKSGEIKIGVSDGLASMFIIGAMSFVPEWFDPQRSTSDEIAEYYTKLIFDGLSSKKRSSAPAN
jgi:hypothetical protein